MNRPINRCCATRPAGIRLAVLLMAAAIVPGCGPSAQVVMRDGESAQPYMQFSVVVDREAGSLGPAQVKADAICAEVLQSSLMYMSADVGDDRTRYYFRCR